MLVNRNKIIKSAITAMLIENGYKKGVDFQISTSTMYITNTLLTSRGSISAFLELHFPHNDFVWEQERKLVWH